MFVIEDIEYNISGSEVLFSKSIFNFDLIFVDKDVKFQIS